MIYKVYFSNSGVALTGLTATWASLLTEAGAAYTPQPTITEIGGGWYKFTATFTESVVGVIDGSASITVDVDRYIPFNGDVIEGLTFLDYLKRMKVVFDGTIERTDGTSDRTLVFKDLTANTETTHTISTTGRTVS